ncbi:uncharacterized protein LOC112468008 [Temnothorax curvispinosus]|uniref:Uncharacterized protein LOC112468008 n=1 Tax=Temnothorax curvispinosus TaxID=300111 RepID=A0A6J1RJ09_9HYME|nr:uncharacterized protein LOC112468008 [Temnothorax curvispinosus]
MERVAEKVLSKVPKIRRVWERRVEGGREVLIVEMEDEKERAVLLGRYGEFRQRWGIGVNEDLTMEERKARWRSSLLSADFNSVFSEIYQLDVDYQVISNNLLASAFTYHELEKVASTFDLDVGGLLLLEATNLNDAVLVGSKRTLYFSTETSIAKLIQVLSEWILHDKSLALTKNALAEPTIYSLDEENRRRFPASLAYDVLVTLVNPDPEKLKIVWDLRTVTEVKSLILTGWGDNHSMGLPITMYLRERSCAQCLHYALQCKSTCSCQLDHLEYFCYF